MAAPGLAPKDKAYVDAHDLDTLMQVGCSSGAGPWGPRKGREDGIASDVVYGSSSSLS